jgi:hypothetical protein
MVKLQTLLFGRRSYPAIPNLREDQDDHLFLESLTRGTLVVGRPGSGKTVHLCAQTMWRALAQTEDPIFVLDASGSFFDEFIKMTQRLPTQQREQIEQRLVYDRMGDPEYVTALPFFSKDYGLSLEDQVQRVTQNGLKLNEELIRLTPVVGGIAFREIAPQLYRLLTAIIDEQGNCWQVTEARELLVREEWLRIACKDFGHKVKGAQAYFKRQFLPQSEHERGLRSYTLRSVLGSLDPKPIRARVGYHTPSWTPKEAIRKGLIVLVSGERLINQEAALGILFNDVCSQILAVINERTPHDPNDKPVLMVIDEVPMLLEIKGMADEIGKVSPRYRSRKLQIIVIIHMLAQLDDDLQKKIWGLGNMVCFGIDSHKESYAITQQLFNFDPSGSRRPREMDSPIADQDRTQYLVGANWLQHLPARAVVLKRWIDEGTEDKFVRFIRKTSDIQEKPLRESLTLTKERLLRRNSVPIKDALRVVNDRTLTKKESEKDEESPNFG